MRSRSTKDSTSCGLKKLPTDLPRWWSGCPQRVPTQCGLSADGSSAIPNFDCAFATLSRTSAVLKSESHIPPPFPICQMTWWPGSRGKVTCGPGISATHWPVLPLQTVDRNNSSVGPCCLRRANLRANSVVAARLPCVWGVLTSPWGHYPAARHGSSGGRCIERYGLHAPSAVDSRSGDQRASASVHHTRRRRPRYET